MEIMRIAAGIVLGLGAIGAVFWMTFRNPPARRRLDSSTSDSGNSDVDYLVRNFHDHGHGDGHL